jgi:hypothetical protein
MDTDPLTRDRGNPHDAAPPKGFWIKLPCDQHGGHKGRFNLECPACNSKNASWAPYPQPAPPQAGAIPEPTPEDDMVQEAENLCLRCCERYGESHFDPDTPPAWWCLRCRLAAAERDRDDARRRVEGAVVVMLTMVRRLNLYDSHAKAVADSALQWMKENDCIPSPYRAAPGTGGTTGGGE